jgi:hypothetical protein
MKAFNVGVLHGFSGLNVDEFDPPVDSPRQEMPRSQFTPVIHPDAFWPAALCNDAVERSSYSAAGKAGIYFERQTLTSERVDDAQHA